VKDVAVAVARIITFLCYCGVHIYYLSLRRLATAIACHGESWLI